jgi:hypothetical protein
MRPDGTIETIKSFAGHVPSRKVNLLKLNLDFES